MDAIFEKLVKEGENRTGAEAPARWKDQLHAVQEQVDPRLVGTRRLMTLTPNYHQPVRRISPS